MPEAAAPPEPLRLRLGNITKLNPRCPSSDVETDHLAKFRCASLARRLAKSTSSEAQCNIVFDSNRSISG
ncbi:hypothetical protein PLANPX_4234 [Lacipirellula parvula]|uniref:Uncharacterized protein n=1 Tax=Lacipirellula parvula TaxID=2650471 RepID=A0A5K7XF47_9BACT|nr:hypothetical protein PLANPX_4234 [Lacipirellula parvula]